MVNGNTTEGEGLKALQFILLMVILSVFSLGLAELQCMFHDPANDLYIGKISYRCK